MRVWRMLVEVGPEVWTYIAVAHDHVQAWELVLGSLTARDRKRASLEELEATGEERTDGRPRLIHGWKSAPGGGRGEGASDGEPGLKGSSGTASAKA